MDNPLDDTELVEDFEAEALERLERITDDLLAAEGGERGQWRDVRRELHTLKGAGGFLGLEEFSGFCHELEEFIAAQDPENRPPDAHMFDLLIQGCGVLRSMVDAVRECALSGKPLTKHPQLPAIRQRLRQAS